MKKKVQNAMKVMIYQLRMLRVNNHLTQKQMADILNVSAQSVSAYENGIIRPDIEVLMQYANHFKVDLDSLTGMHILGKVHEIMPTQTEQQLLMAYRRRPEWFKKCIRDLCFNGTRYKTADEEFEGVKILQSF